MPLKKKVTVDITRMRRSKAKQAAKAATALSAGMPTVQRLIAAPAQKARATTMKAVSHEGCGPEAHKLACSLLDPWNCPGCIPDGARGKGCFQIKQTFTMVTDTDTQTGQFVLQMNPFNFCVNYNSGGSGAELELPAATPYVPADRYTVIAGLFAKYRAVSAGIKARYIGSQMNSQGRVVLAQISGNLAATGIIDTQTVDYVKQQAMFATIGSLREGGTLLWRPEDQEDYKFQSFDGASSTTAEIVPQQTPWLVVAFTGAQANSGCLALDVVVNFEGQYRDQTLTIGENAGPSQAAAKKPAEAGWFEKAMNAVSKWSPVVAKVADDILPGAGSVVNAIGGIASTVGRFFS